MKKLIFCAALATALIPRLGLAQGALPGVAAQMHAIEADKAARTPNERKLDANLHFLSREAVGQPAVAGAPLLTSRVELEPDGRVTVDISAAPTQGLKDAITLAGGTVVYESVRWNSVRAILPPAALPKLADRPDVKHIAKGTKPITHFYNYFSDAAENAVEARPEFGVSGSGVKVGVISDSDDKSAALVSSGELPLFTELPGLSGHPGTGEGTAMAAIVHATAPGAHIYFATASGGKPAFADSIIALQNAGCQIIVDDISYGDEWQFEDDEIGQAVNTVVNAGATYLSASGNEGNLRNGNSTTWEGDFVDGGTDNLLPGGHVHSFGTQNYNTLPTGKSAATLQWSDEYHSSNNDYNLYILNAAGTAIVATSNNPQDGSEAPMESVDNVKAGERIVIWKSDAAAPRYLRLSCTGSPLKIQTAGQTIGHAATPNCICVASSDASLAAPGSFTAASLTEKVSSDGPHHMFYISNGSGIGTPITPGNFLSTGGTNILTPDLTAGDGDNTSVPGFTPFYGTSAAAPMAAAIGALVLERNPNLTNSQLRAVLESSCIDIDDAGFDVNSGNGILMADTALANAGTNAQIVVEQPALTNLPIGGSRSFGSVAVSSTADLVFTVRNAGSATLTGLGASITGTDSFSIVNNPSASLPAYTGSASFTVQFSPVSLGYQTATLHIASNDPAQGDFTVNLSGLAPDPASIGQDDQVTATTGDTVIYPLANDISTSGTLSIVGVSDPTILIQGRALVIPAGFTGSFIYSVTDGTTTGYATVVVSGGTPQVALKAWTGLLYDSDHTVRGFAHLNQSSGGTLTGNIIVGSTRAAVSGFKLVSAFAAHNTSLGTFTAIEKATGRIQVSLSGATPLTGSLRPDNTAATKGSLHIALPSIDSSILGGGYAQASISKTGAIGLSGKLPDGRAFTSAAHISDNNGFVIYAVAAGTKPQAVVAGELINGNLPSSDMTGELAWTLPPQKAGILKIGANTILTADGSLFTSGSLPASGAGTLTFSAGNFVAPSASSTVVTGGKPTLPAFGKSWTVNLSAGTFKTTFTDPVTNKTITGTGVYLPKSLSAWGYFPGSTTGGSILLQQ